MAGWNELVRKTRLALADEAELRTKAGLLLSPAEIRFNDVMEDFIAEMHAAQYLRSLGHADIHFLSENDAIRTDLQSRGGECVYVTEAKNLREPRALTKIAFSRWNMRKAAEPGSYEFMASLVAMDDPLGDLTIEQANAVDAIIDDLPRWKRPSEQQRQLPGGRRISIRVNDGPSHIVRYGGGPFRVDGDNGIVAQGQRNLMLKLLEHTRKALSQLYADPVPDAYRRLLYVRWKPPEEFCVTPDGVEQVRTNAREGFRSLIKPYFPHFAIAILHTGEDPEHAAPVRWE